MIMVKYLGWYVDADEDEDAVPEKGPIVLKP